MDMDAAALTDGGVKVETNPRTRRRQEEKCPDCMHGGTAASALVIA